MVRGDGDRPRRSTRCCSSAAGADGEPTAQDWAEACDTISYEMVTRIGGRMSRRYVGAREPTREPADEDDAASWSGWPAPASRAWRQPGRGRFVQPGRQVRTATWVTTCPSVSLRGCRGRGRPPTTG